MRRIALGLGLAVTTGLAACGNNDMERGVVGATVAGVGAAVVGANIGQMAAASAVGAAAGALCDDAGVCK